jgi:glutamate N-acetyltransferase/amino-acid N-acetyltransferase
MKRLEESLVPLLPGGTYTSVPGTRIGVGQAAIKKKNVDDVVVLVAAGSAAGVTTLSTAASAPCLWTRSQLPGSCHAVVVNSGNANAATGSQGVADARAMAEAVAGVLGCEATQVLVASTGVIGVPMPMDRVIPAVQSATRELTADGHRAAQAILTTDLVAKEAAVCVDGMTIGGLAKGSGMIHPNMGTMLAFLATDVSAPAAALQTLVEEMCERTFNAVTVDGDTSTSDIFTLQTTNQGRSIQPGTAEWASFTSGLYSVCRHLARAIARDGEGATRLLTVQVEGLSDTDARVAARAVARSPLVKTAVHGRDANWGRVVGALGAAGVPGLDRLDLDLCGIPVLRRGTPVAFDEDVATQSMGADEVVIYAKLPGSGFGEAWGCDLSAGYVSINADYRS